MEPCRHRLRHTWETEMLLRCKLYCKDIGPTKDVHAAHSVQTGVQPTFYTRHSRSPTVNAAIMNQSTHPHPHPTHTHTHTHTHPWHTPTPMTHTQHTHTTLHAHTHTHTQHTRTHAQHSMHTHTQNVTPVCQSSFAKKLIGDPWRFCFLHFLVQRHVHGNKTRWKLCAS